MRFYVDNNKFCFTITKLTALCSAVSLTIVKIATIEKLTALRSAISFAIVTVIDYSTA